MIRKIIGFIPAAFWLFLTVIGWIGFDPYGPKTIPWGLIILLILSVFSGILLCSKKYLPLGIVIGLIEGAYLLLYLPAKTMSDRIVPISVITFYVIYAVCYFVYNRELKKNDLR